MYHIYDTKVTQKVFINERKCKKIIKILFYFALFTILNMFCVAAINDKQKGLIYVLMWTSHAREPFSHFKPGLRSLILMNCKFQNCFFTPNKKYFSDPTEYDAILFNAPNINKDMKVPKMRSDGQIYVFVSTESASYYPISEKFDNFFNYTWSYKLNSDIPYPYFVVRKKGTGKVTAPKPIVNWRSHKNMKLTPQSVLRQLRDKSTTAAWFVSNCYARDQRLDYVRQLQREFQKFDQVIDIFGICDATKQCPKNKSDVCFELLKTEYFFYLSFENSFSEDYVTEKVLTAVNNFAVPVVYGGANYSRFLPDGSYINALLYTPQALAIKMNDIIKNKQDYYDYFKFYRYYTYHTIDETEDIHPLCVFCKFINRVSIWKNRRTYARFSLWWTT